jgi:uncharacterized protein (DUF3084 family)
MPTATAVSTTQEQDLEIIQQREALALKVKHARQQEEKQRREADEFGQTLLDALKSGQDVAKTVTDLADRLQQLTQQREHAERELGRFEKKNEPNSVVQARIDARLEAEREAARLQRIKPHADEFARRFNRFREDFEYFRMLPADIDSGKVELGNPFYVREMCHVLTRNLMTNDQRYKIVHEGGGGWESYEKTAKSAGN